jgi:hypothetical protein
MDSYWMAIDSQMGLAKPRFQMLVPCHQANAAALTEIKPGQSKRD